MNHIPELGAFGGKHVTTTTAQTGTWFAITCFSATVFATLTEIGGEVQDGTTGSIVFPAGITIWGAFTNFTLTSGSVRAYASKQPTTVKA